MQPAVPSNSGPCAVPLIDRLRSVPRSARGPIPCGPDHRIIPYGAFCHEAADALEAMAGVTDWPTPTTPGTAQASCRKLVADIRSTSLVRGEECAREFMEHIIAETQGAMRSLVGPTTAPKFTVALPPADHATNLLAQPLDNFSEMLANEVAAAKDDLISKAITRHLGNADWMESKFAMVGRLRRNIYPDCQGETWALDGAPMLYLRRVETTTEEQGLSHRLKVSFKYQFIDKP